MHFSKTYTQLLLTLPEELRNNAIEYRQLKKLIKRLVAELDSLGLNPEVLQDLLQRNEGDGATHSEASKGKQRAIGERPFQLGDIIPPTQATTLAHDSIPSSTTKAAYELHDVGSQGRIVPRLRLWIEQMDDPKDIPNSSVVDDPETSDDLESQPGAVGQAQPLSHVKPSRSLRKAEGFFQQDGFSSSEEVIALSSPIMQHREDLLWKLQAEGCPAALKHSSSWIVEDEPSVNTIDASAVSCTGKTNREVVIPLASDTEFYRLLTNALESLATALDNTTKDMSNSVDDLRRTVSQTARPASTGRNSDLYTWRSVFQVYMEAEVFESTQESSRGERTVEDSEARLSQFVQRVANGGFKFKLKASQEGLQRFLEFNVRLMNIKKFQNASAEAARKIMKKHAKQTALPVPNSAMENLLSLDFSQGRNSISHILVVTMTESLLPIIPHIDDYLCLICTSLAFKPIRLNCGHLFCVRCLVKMQKRGQNNCPMCRAPNVIAANQKNLDLAVLNLMRDWFPKELKEKSKANEKEVAEEELEALGLDDRCRIM